MKKSLIAAGAAFIALATAFPAATQTCGPGYGPCGGAGPGYGPGMMNRGGGPGGYGDPVARSDARLSALRTQLALDASQQAAWQAYESAVRAQAQDMAEDRARMWSAGTAPERAALRAEMMADHAAGHAKVAEALRGLYAVLNATQRAVLDSGSGRGFGGMGRW